MPQMPRTSAARAFPRAAGVERLAGRRSGHQTPMSITNEVQMGPCTITYDGRVLTPRPWTLVQSNWAAELAPGLPASPILELCSGAGQIGLVAAVETGRALVQVDADFIACEFAQANARTAGIADRVEVRHSTVEDAVAPHERFGLVLADPPYVRSSEVSRWPADPRSAIDGGEDGLELARRCLEVAASALAPGGTALMQLRGRSQIDQITHEFRHLLELIEIREVDPERAIGAWRPKISDGVWRIPASARRASDAPFPHCLDRAIEAASAGDDSLLWKLTTCSPVDEHDSLSALLLIHELFLAPAEVIGARIAVQSHPAIAATKWALEGALTLRLESRAAARLISKNPADALRRVAAADLVPPIYKWLRDESTWPELVEFLTWEGGPDAGFDDFVALTQVGIRGGPKVALAANYWDELGRGRLEAVHTVLHDQLVAATGMRRVPRGELSASALERLAIGGMLATNRALQPEALGAFGLIELQAGPRCRAVVFALRRLDAPEGAFPFYEEHAEADPHHGRAWLNSIIVPLSQSHTEWGPRMVRGAQWRSEVNRRFFADAAVRFIAPPMAKSSNSV